MSDDATDRLLKAFREGEAERRRAIDQFGVPPCSHEKCLPAFDVQTASNMDAFEIKRNFPRFDGVCPECLQNVIVYASFEHYVAGDW